MSADPVQNINEQLKAIRGELDTLKGSTLGDRNDIESYKRTLRGRLEIIEASALEFVSQTEYKKLEKAVTGLSETVAKATGVLNWSVRTIAGTALVAIATLIINRIIGGG